MVSTFKILPLNACSWFGLTKATTGELRAFGIVSKMPPSLKQVPLHNL